METPVEIAGGVPSLYADFSSLLPDLKTAPDLGTGLVSFAFHPEFATNGIFYPTHIETVGSTPPNLEPAIPVGAIQHSIVTEWTASNPAANVFAGTSRELIRVPAGHTSHNMGEVAFNPNAGLGHPDYGLLYICAGEYSSVFLGVPEQLQRLDTPYGTLMRINPLGGPFMRGGTTYDYGIPPDNPFANDPDPSVLGEIYAYGFRNGHRIATNVKPSRVPQE